MGATSYTSRRTMLKLVAGAGTAAALPLAGPQRFAAADEPSARKAQPGGRTIYVRAGAAAGNSGLSPNSPLGVLQKAADISEPGDTVLIQNGTYRDTDTPGAVAALHITRSGTAEAPIRFLAHPGHSPVLRSSFDSFEGILIAGAAYIEVAGLTVIGNSEVLTYEEAFATQDGSKAKFNANGINVRIDKTTLARPHHVIIRDNLVRHWPGGGIAGSDGDYYTFTGNIVHSNAWYSVYANSGMTVIRPYNADDDTSGYRNVVNRNLCYDNEGFIPWRAVKRLSDGNGIIIDTTTAQFEATGVHYTGRTLVTNNISFSNGGSGIHAFQVENTDIVNNTVFDNSRSPTLHYPGLGAWRSKDCNVLNNISYLRTGEPTNNNDRNVNVVYDYNIYYNGAAPAVLGPHDLVTDPLLVGPSDTADAGGFRLRHDSPAIDSGTSTLAPDEDFAGKQRPRGVAVDRGAFERRAAH